MDKEQRDKPTVKQLKPANEAVTPPTPEVGGREGPEPTRYGDWEIKGKCVDF